MDSSRRTADGLLRTHADSERVDNAEPTQGSAFGPAQAGDRAAGRPSGLGAADAGSDSSGSVYETPRGRPFTLSESALAVQANTAPAPRSADGGTQTPEIPERRAQMQPPRYRPEMPATSARGRRARPVAATVVCVRPMGMPGPVVAAAPSTRPRKVRLTHGELAAMRLDQPNLSYAPVWEPALSGPEATSMDGLAAFKQVCFQQENLLWRSCSSRDAFMALYREVMAPLEQSASVRQQLLAQPDGDALTGEARRALRTARRAQANRLWIIVERLYGLHGQLRGSINGERPEQARRAQYWLDDICQALANSLAREMHALGGQSCDLQLLEGGDDGRPTPVGACPARFARTHEARPEPTARGGKPYGPLRRYGQTPIPDRSRLPWAVALDAKRNEQRRKAEEWLRHTPTVRGSCRGKATDPRRVKKSVKKFVRRCRAEGFPDEVIRELLHETSQYMWTLRHGGRGNLRGARDSDAVKALVNALRSSAAAQGLVLLSVRASGDAPVPANAEFLRQRCRFNWYTDLPPPEHPPEGALRRLLAPRKWAIREESFGAQRDRSRAHERETAREEGVSRYYEAVRLGLALGKIRLATAQIEVWRPGQGHELIDADILMPPGDTWNGSVVVFGTGSGGTAHMWGAQSAIGWTDAGYACVLAEPLGWERANPTEREMRESREALIAMCQASPDVGGLGIPALGGVVIDESFSLSGVSGAKLADMPDAQVFNRPLAEAAGIIADEGGLSGALGRQWAETRSFLSSKGAVVGRTDTPTLVVLAQDDTRMQEHGARFAQTIMAERSARERGADAVKTVMVPGLHENADPLLADPVVAYWNAEAELLTQEDVRAEQAAKLECLREQEARAAASGGQPGPELTAAVNVCEQFLSTLGARLQQARTRRDRAWETVIEAGLMGYRTAQTAAATGELPLTPLAPPCGDRGNQVLAFLNERGIQPATFRWRRETRAAAEPRLPAPRGVFDLTASGSDGEEAVSSDEAHSAPTGRRAGPSGRYPFFDFGASSSSAADDDVVDDEDGLAISDDSSTEDG